MELTTQSMGKIKTLQKKKKTYASLMECVYNHIYEEIEKENKLSHSIITSNNKKKHTCVPWAWDNIKATKKKKKVLAHPK